MESSQVVATSNPDEGRILEKVDVLVRQLIEMNCGRDDLQRRLNLLRDSLFTSISACGPEVILMWNATSVSSIVPVDLLSRREELSNALRVSLATTTKFLLHLQTLCLLGHKMLIHHPFSYRMLDLQSHPTGILARVSPIRK
jgi:hypothetical protein